MKYSHLRAIAAEAEARALRLAQRAYKSEAKLELLKNVHISALDDERVQGHLLRYPVRVSRRHMEMIGQDSEKYFADMAQRQAIGAMLEALLDSGFIHQRSEVDYESLGEVQVFTFDLKVAK